MEQRAHITSKLDNLRKKVLTMAGLTHLAFSKATEAFMENDWEQAELVIQDDDAIDMTECDLVRYSLELLALTQPMARDLRLIVGSMRISIQLERIGDEAVNLAQRTVSLSMKPLLPLDQNMRTLASLCHRMLADSIVSYADSNTSLAEAVCSLDQEADALHYKVLTRMISNMVEESRIVECGVFHIMAAKHFERVADFCTNIAKSLIFIVK